MANLGDGIVTVAGMNGNKDNLTVDSQHNNPDQELHNMYHNKQNNMSENTIDGESQEADIDDIEWDKDHDWSISRFSYEKSSGEYLKMFNGNCDGEKKTWPRLQVLEMSLLLIVVNLCLNRILLSTCLLVTVLMLNITAELC